MTDFNYANIVMTLGEPSEINHTNHFILRFNVRHSSGEYDNGGHMFEQNYVSFYYDAANEIEKSQFFKDYIDVCLLQHYQENIEKCSYYDSFCLDDTTHLVIEKMFKVLTDKTYGHLGEKSLNFRNADPKAYYVDSNSCELTSEIKLPELVITTLEELKKLSEQTPKVRGYREVDKALQAQFLIGYEKIRLSLELEPQTINTNNTNSKRTLKI